MISITLRGDDIEKAKRVLAMLGDQARPAVARAVNRAVQGVATDAGQMGGRLYNVRSGDVKKSFTLVKASPGNLTGMAVSKGKVLSLRLFSPSPGPGKKRPAGGLSVVIKRQSGRLRVSGAFWGMLSRGNAASVFRRLGNVRLPIEKLFGPSVPQMLGNKNVADRIQEKAAERYGTNLDHEINRLFANLGAR